MSRDLSDNLISPQAADLLISLRDGDAALLYLYFCRHGFGDLERASRELFMPRSRFSEAFERLEMQGLIREDAFKLLPHQRNAAEEKKREVAPPAPGGDLPSYSAADIRFRTDTDNAFSALLNEAKLILGRPLSTPDLNKMLGMYDHFGLPAEVMMELMHFVAEVYRERYQESRRPTVGAFEKEARIWVSREIGDLDAAEQYIRRWRERHSMEAELKDAMQIRDRDFTDTERRNLTQWLDWGFHADAIALAYDITVTKLRKFSPAYMNKILQNWHEKGIHSLPEIKENDRIPQSREKSSNHQVSPASINAGLLDVIKQSMNRKEG